MRQWEVLALALALLLASAPAFALPTPSPGPFLPRGPILVASDADFTAANGVVGGNGTPADPYVIAGWGITSGGTAIKVYNVTASFVVRDNAIDAPTGVHITQSTGAAAVVNNKFVVKNKGVYVVNADATIVDNSFIGEAAYAAVSRAVDLVNSNSRVESNAFVYVHFGVRAERGSPQILCNDLHDDVIEAAIYVRLTTNATISCNIITRCYGAIASVSAIGTVIVNNTITDCNGGVSVVLTKDVTVANNTLSFGAQTQLHLDTVSGNVTGNVFVDGRADAVVIHRSPVLFANNTVTAHLGAGIRVSETNPVVEANVVSDNAVGIEVEPGAVPTLRANVVSNNSVGLDLPYASRQAIVHMEANVVNGVNVDGTLDASERIFFYHESNVSISTTMDGGFGAGYFGSITAQGGILLWEVDTARIDATLVSHQTVGVSVINSFDVVVNGSVLSANGIGIRAEAIATTGPVPSCVVSVKDTNITIPVDPPATMGIDVKGCLAIVARTNVSVVDTGIRVDAQGGLLLSGSTIHDTRLALDVAGSTNLVNLSGNRIYGNLAGARLSGTQGLVANNTFLDNDAYGIRLENGAQIDLHDNRILANGVGLVDAEPCAGPLSCSIVRARGNELRANVGDGARVHGASTWRGDVAADNGGAGFVLMSQATLRNVTAVGNDGDGARIVGTFDVEGSLFQGNGEDGLELLGGGALDGSLFVDNDEAGIRVTPTSVSALGLVVTGNLDGIVVAGSGVSGLEVHLSTLASNLRDALRADLALVNATHNHWGRAEGPPLSIGGQIGAFQNGVSPTVRFVPYFTTASMDETGPVDGL